MMSRKMVDILREAGVVGAGGAGFPTHVKLGANAEVLIVNAAECEPLIRVDQQLLLNYTQEFLQGVRCAADLTGAQRVIIALKAKHQEIVRHLKQAVTDDRMIELSLLGDYYPAGDEHILVNDVLDRVVPRGGIPLAVGVVVSNVETLLNVARAQSGVPVTTTFVTISGKVPSPATFELPVGISYQEALGLAGITDTEGLAGIDGGPMMGELITSFAEPITKTTKAIIVLDKDHRVIVEKAMSDNQILKQSRTACEQCQKCTDLCPRDLLGHDVKPHLTMRIVNYGLSDFSGMKHSFGCSLCGACALYACPVNLSPRRVNALIIDELSAAGIRNETTEGTPTASSLFHYRKIPTRRLIARLGLTAYDAPAPLSGTEYQPQQVKLLLSQHVGAPATAVVEVGDRVVRGAVVGRIEDGSLGATLHASIDGTVNAVDQTAVLIKRN